jgi:F0F1-type ATP synthase gamma subunit
VATIVEIKRELGSIGKISKITNAMKIIAISKIAKAKKNYLEVLDLMNNVHETIKILAYQLSKTRLMEDHTSKPVL